MACLGNTISPAYKEIIEIYEKSFENRSFRELHVRRYKSRYRRPEIVQYNEASIMMRFNRLALVYPH